MAALPGHRYFPLSPTRYRVRYLLFHRLQTSMERRKRIEIKALELKIV